MTIRLLKAYRLNTGKVMPMGKIFPRERKEAAQMVKDKIAEYYDGKRPHKLKTEEKMKTELFKPKK